MTATATIISRIRLLPDLLVDKIAAGEVIEDPASVVKELLENALDSGASSIQVATTAGGLESIAVHDNGSGILFEDLPLAVERHATSKIKEISDLDSICSMGFRGEALASIASVSRLEIRTRHESEKKGGHLIVRGGVTEELKAIAHAGGVSVSVHDLFYPVPARRKFQKSEKHANLRIYQEILKIAIANYKLQIEYLRDSRQYLFLPAHNCLEERLLAIFSQDLAPHLISCNALSEHFKIQGFLASGDYFRPRSDRQYLFINGRAVEIKQVGPVLKKAYGELLPPGSFPCFFLFIAAEPNDLDVNVHPAKKEVRILNQSKLIGMLMNMAHGALHRQSPVALEQKARHLQPVPIAMELALSSSGIGVSPAFEIKGQPGTVQTPDRMPGAEPNQESASAFRPQFIKHSGRIFGTYILAEAQDGFYFIDQHTAHERINYEKMRNRFAELRRQKQALLAPRIITISPAELDALEENLEQVNQNGFLVERYSEDSLVLREIPGYLQPGTEETAVWHLLSRIAEGETSFKLYEELAAMKACKASIKKNDNISGEVISGILNELQQCDEPLRCPHGRPTLIRITQNELDRMFMRIQ